MAVSALRGETEQRRVMIIYHVDNMMCRPTADGTHSICVTKSPAESTKNNELEDEGPGVICNPQFLVTSFQ